MIALSDKKNFLQVAEIISYTACAFDVGILAALSARQLKPNLAESLLWSAGILSLFICVIVFMLIGEFRKAIHDEDSEGISPQQMLALVEWAPWPQRALGVLGIVFTVLAIIAFGSGDASDELAMTRRGAESLAMGELVAALLALPVLASAARMPGAFEDNFE